MTTTQEVKELIEENGIGNALAMVGADQLEDSYLAYLWKLAEQFCIDIERHVGIGAGAEFESEIVAEPAYEGSEADVFPLYFGETEAYLGDSDDSEQGQYGYDLIDSSGVIEWVGVEAPSEPSQGVMDAIKYKAMARFEALLEARELEVVA